MVSEFEWRKASGCTNSTTCVEVAFRKAGACSNGGQCVEVGGCGCDGGTVYVRDGKDPDGPVLRFTNAEWDAFLDGVVAGEFDHG